MVQEQTAEEVQEAATEPSKASLHIFMPTEAYERIKKFAECAAIEGLIEGHARGNLTSYCDFCLNLGEHYLKQYMLKKRGYK